MDFKKWIFFEDHKKLGIHIGIGQNHKTAAEAKH